MQRGAEGSEESQGVLRHDPSVQQKLDVHERLSSAATRAGPKRKNTGADDLTQGSKQQSGGFLFLAMGKSPYQENMLRRMRTQKASVKERVLSRRSSQSPGAGPSSNVTTSSMPQSAVSKVRSRNGSSQAQSIKKTRNLSAVKRAAYAKTQMVSKLSNVISHINSEVRIDSPPSGSEAANRD